MNKVLVTVIDSAKARFLTLDLAEFSDIESASRLVELNELLNPVGDAQGEELWSTTKTGRNRGNGGQAHSYDDHREQHRAEFERRFAQAIATYIATLVEAEPIRHLILVAESQIVTVMKAAIAAAAPSQLQIHELMKNLSHLKPHELHKYLASHGLVPEPARLP